MLRRTLKWCQLAFLVGALSVTSLPAQQKAAPSTTKAKSTRVRTSDRSRMQQLAREGERLLKAGETTPIEKLMEGLKQPRAAVKFNAPRTSPLPAAELYRRARKSVVVLSSLYYCTKCTRLHATVAGGVVVGNSGEVLTNAHVVRGRATQKRETIVAMTSEGRVIPVREVLAASEAHDVALIRLDASNLPALPLGKNPEPGSPIRVLGHPNQHFYSLTDGIVSRYYTEHSPAGETRVMSITADFGRGSSGGPVLDLAGNVVGIASRTSSLYYRQSKGVQENLQMVFKLSVAASSIRSLSGAPVPSLVKALPAVTLTGLPKDRGSVQKPLVVDSNEQLGKLIPDEELARQYGKRIDWAKQRVLVFRWSGSGQDQLETRSVGKAPAKVQFVLRPGRTRDLRPHLRLFAIERVALWSVVRGTVGRPGVPKPVGVTRDGREFSAVEAALQVRRRGTLVFCRPTEAGLEKLDAFLEAFPKSKHREEGLYLRALSLWNMKRYGESASGYRVLLDEFPKGRHTRLARIREAGGLLFSDSPERALDRLNALMIDYPDSPEMYGRERAHALVLLGRLDEAAAFMDDIESTMLADNKKAKLVPRMQMQFAPLRMVGKPLKPFSVRRHGHEGMIDSHALEGKVVLVDFWAAWCRPCMAEMPHLRSAHKRFSDKGFQIVSISLDDDRKRFETVVAGEKMNWLHHFDGQKWKNEVAVLFDVHSIPMNLLVDRKGIVRAVNLRGVAVARRVEELLREKSAAEKR